MLVIAGFYFTIKTKFVQLRLIGEMVRLLGDGMVDSSKGDKGVSAFGAFALRTASRVGTGNLAGVSLAISIGGPEAVFWMWLIAIIGSASAFVEPNKAVNNWFPIRERARAVGMNQAGGPLGGAIAGPVVDFMAIYWGWEYAFIVLAVIGLLWTIAWNRMFTDDPSSHP